MSEPAADVLVSDMEHDDTAVHFQPSARNKARLTLGRLVSHISKGHQPTYDFPPTVGTVQVTGTVKPSTNRNPQASAQREVGTVGAWEVSRCSQWLSREFSSTHSWHPDAHNLCHFRDLEWILMSSFGPGLGTYDSAMLGPKWGTFVTFPTCFPSFLFFCGEAFLCRSGWS